MYQSQLKTVDVTCAIIVDESNLILVTQRSQSMSLPLKWEFPGGKIELNETAEECLIREIKEELGIDVGIVKNLTPNRHTYPAININLIPFICKLIGGKINLAEHAAYKWLHANELSNLDWADADVPIVKNYLNYLNAN
ncbi:MAG: (deoxy)nucleoside triphosphate pyrophosphohydrolase [Mucilaginibacter sp.]